MHVLCVCVYSSVSLRDSKDVNQYKLTSRIWMPKLGFSHFISHARLGCIVDLACPVLGTLVRMVAPLLMSPQRSCSEKRKILNSDAVKMTKNGEENIQELSLSPRLCQGRAHLTSALSPDDCADIGDSETMKIEERAR